MPAPLIDLLRAGVPALLCLVVGIVVIRFLCRRPALRRLSFALSLFALTASVALFRTLVPAEATLLAAASEYEGPGGDRAGQLLGRMRRFFGRMGGE
jgi:hypothetical protein